MSLKKILPLLFIVFLTTALCAAEPETKAQNTPPDNSAADNTAAITIPAAPDEPVIPKRELKFDVSEEEVQLPLEDMKEGMLDQRYVATFRLVVPKKEKPSQESSARGRGGRMPGAERVVGFVNATTAGMPTFLLSSRRFGGAGAPFDYIAPSRELLECQEMLIGNPRGYWGLRQLPKGFFLTKWVSDDNKPPKEIIAASEELNSIFTENIFSYDDAHYPTFDQIRLLSPAVEDAKKCVAAWTVVYDRGICCLGQKDCLDIRKKLVQKLAGDSERLKKAETDRTNAQQEIEKYKDFEDISPESIVALTTQRRMLAVDLVGVKARIKACQEMLASENVPAARKDQIENSRIAAEIELRGLDAKQAEIDHIIQGAQSRQKLATIIKDPGNTINVLKGQVEQDQTGIQMIDEYRLGYEPLPVEDGKVTIRRIKWISPPKTENTKPGSPSAPQ